MSQEPDDIKRWTARRKAAEVMDIIRGKTTAAELARTHDLTLAKVEQWMDDFVSTGTETAYAERVASRFQSRNHDFSAPGRELPTFLPRGIQP
jgi:transposase-like protein